VSVVVVGASLAGVRAAEELRAAGYAGRVTIVGDEPHAPYDRPPLSKQVLAGSWPTERAALHVSADGGLDGLDVDLRLGVRATALDLAARTVTVRPATGEGPDGDGGRGERGGRGGRGGRADGEALAFDGLVIATGCAARRLPGTDGVAGLHVLRTLADCDALRAALGAGARRVVVVGGGFIGAEVASTCRGLDVEVTLVEALPVPLGRVLGDDIGAVLADLHREHGVDVRLGVGVEGFDTEPDPTPGGAGARVRAVRLADGSTVEADVVVVGIGVVPNTGWLEGSGLHLDNGVVCDATTLAAPGVVAAGDVARWPSTRAGGLVRVEHWDNAITMGQHAARRLLAELGRPGGAVEAYDPVPWFWSDQYDRKLQLAGHPVGADEVRVVDGSTDERRFVALYRRGDDLAAVLAMNRPRPVITFRRLLSEGAGWSEALVAAGVA
jgi:3-phenylpropionate/trans-cinnamate dioxygenase ferredoxin reductase component